MDNVALGTVGVVVALVASVLGGFVTLTGVIGKRRLWACRSGTR